MKHFNEFEFLESVLKDRLQDKIPENNSSVSSIHKNINHVNQNLDTIMVELSFNKNLLEKI